MMNSPALASGLVLLIALSSNPGPARADIGNPLGDLAKQVASELKQLEQTEVSVDGFNDTGRLESSAGPMIQSRLIGELKKLGVGVKLKAPYYLTGEFLSNKKAAKGQLGLKLITKLRDKDDEVAKVFTTTLDYKSNEDLVKLFVMSVDLSKKYNDTPEGINKHLKEKQEKPDVYTKGDEIKVRKDSPYAVKILAAKSLGPKDPIEDDAFEHRPATVEDDHTRVSLSKGEEYRIRLCNTSKNEIAVAITIDGLDAFEFFEPGKVKPAYYLVAPGKERVVKGWKINTKKDEAFLVGSLEHSAAAKLYKPSHTIGTITIRIYPAWVKDNPPDAYKDLPKSIGTERGRPLPNPSETLEREIGPLFEAISIRYKKD